MQISENQRNTLKEEEEGNDLTVTHFIKKYR